MRAGDATEEIEEIIRCIKEDMIVTNIPFDENHLIKFVKAYWDINDISCAAYMFSSKDDFKLRGKEMSREQFIYEMLEEIKPYNVELWVDEKSQVQEFAIENGLVL